MKIKTITLLLVLTWSVGFAQKIKPLTVGDKVPDIFYETMLNHTSASGKLSDFKGKAIIIDMWFRECGSCIKAFPHLDSLQQAYKNDLKVILATWQSKEKIEEFWRQRTIDYKFTQVVNDTITRAMFPATSFPHQIWIDKNGVVKSINDGFQSTDENIKGLIGNQQLEIAEKKDELDPRVINVVEPLPAIRYEDNKNKIMYYSYLSKYRPEFSGKALFRQRENGISRFTFTNMYYAYLYDMAYKGGLEGAFDSVNRVSREDHSPMEKSPNYKTKSNIFCYELIVPDSVRANFGKYMIVDLDRHFGFKSHEEVRKVRTLVIRPNGKGTKYRDKLVPNEKTIVETNDFANGKVVRLNNAPVSNINDLLISYSTIRTVIELPEEVRRFSINVVWNTNDLASFNNELKKFDLEAKFQRRDYKVVVLRDAK